MRIILKLFLGICLILSPLVGLSAEYKIGKVHVYCTKNLKEKDLKNLKEWLDHSQKALKEYTKYKVVRPKFPTIIRVCINKQELCLLTGLTEHFSKDGKNYTVVAACDKLSKVIYLTSVVSDDFYHELGHWYLEDIKDYDAEEAKADDFMEFCLKYKEK